jgi:hypothetical protein
LLETVAVGSQFGSQILPPFSVFERAKIILLLRARVCERCIESDVVATQGTPLPLYVPLLPMHCEE